MWEIYTWKISALSLSPGGCGAAKDVKAALIDGPGGGAPLLLEPLMKSLTTLGFSGTNLAITGLPRSAIKSQDLLALLNFPTISECSVTRFWTAGFLFDICLERARFGQNVS